MTEAELEREVARQCRELGIIRFHAAHPAAMSARGFPDDLLIGTRGMKWRELKSETGEVSDDQLLVARRLRTFGQDWHTWRPSDLRVGLIRLELEAIA